MRELKILENLIHTNRYSGNLLIKEESVSDHIWSMITLAIEYVPKINSMFNLDFKLSEVIYGIALHDLDEAFYCDIPRTFKYHNEKLTESIKTTVENILQENLNTEILNDLKLVEDRSHPLGALIKIFDIAQAGLKMKFEINMGNSYFINELPNALDSFIGLKKKIDEGDYSDNEKHALYYLIQELTNVINES